jgi:hypothetical protein
MIKIFGDFRMGALFFPHEKNVNFGVATGKVVIG